MWHDVVALEEQRSYQSSISVVQEIVVNESPVHRLSVGHGVEVVAIRAWFLDIIPLTSSLLFPILFFGYNLLPFHIAFLVLVIGLGRTWIRRPM